jgi:hypothetical protein
MSRRANPKGKRRLSPRVLFWSAVVLLTLVGALFVFRPQPLDDLDTLLRERGFTPNPGFASTFRPGDVLQIADAHGPLARPVLFLTREDCFPGFEPLRSAFALPRWSGKRSGSINLTGSKVAKALPQLDLAGSGAKSYSLEIERPSVETFAKGQLSETFSPLCVQRFGRAIKAGDSEAWYGTVTETVVADALTLTLEWEAGTSGDAHAKLADAARKGLLAQKGTADVRLDSKEKTILSATGPLVLGYLYRPMEGVKKSDYETK